MKGYQGDIKRKAILVLGFVFLILLALNIIPRLFGESNIFVVPEDSEYEVRIPARGILVRDEKIYFSSTDGDVFKVVKEGERVRVGQKVVDILLLEDTTDLKEELNQIENIIQFYDELHEDLKGENSLNGEGVDLLVSKLYQQLSDGDYKGVNDTKESIALYYDTLENFSGEFEGFDITTDELRNRRDHLLSRISQYNKSIYSLNSGLVSYKVDGLEDELVQGKLSDLDIGIFNKVETDNTNENGALFKIIDDYQWNLLVKIADETPVNYQVGDILEVIISSFENNNIVEIKMPVVEIIESNDEKFYNLRGTNFLEKIFDKRYVNVEIIDLKEDTFKIPVDAIVEVDGTTGVKVKEFYGVVTFRPVEIVAVDDRYAFVSKGDNNGYIDIGEETFRTISLFSEVIVKPDSVNVGEILN
ncbi:HlyD family efflux transporter periplasmic adaptor subunit [Gudongella sp. SC589]|uniref:HlyD family efflux transporter periplasmic adaptor subunit n=1 Tax=Gudongella sp. SC589 TaxID=3385990 RepID=UPI003904C648